ncbi:MAG TPA: peptide deformylase [bacterium]
MNLEKMKSVCQLRLYPDSVLRRKCLPVNDVDGAVRELINGMAEIMYTYNGIGLAAPQVGVLQRIIIGDIGEGLVALANPEIVEKNGDDRLLEGCLSLPDIHVNVARGQSIFVRGISPDGREVNQEFAGLMARIIQHEIDHLNGILIIDYASPTEKIVLNSKLKELRRRHKLNEENESYIQHAKQAEALHEIELKVKLEEMAADEAGHARLLRRILKGL